jgi:cholesterol transport system auxiliary component
MRARNITAMVVLLLAACSPASVPDVTYFRLPPPTPFPHTDKPLTTLPMEVEVFRGEGIYAEQAMIYTNSTDAGSLRTYHYQLWSDPPSRGLQARLTNMLRDSGASTLVTERLPASDQALRVHGRILRYERVKHDPGFDVSVSFEIRVEQDSGEPLVEQTYTAQVSAADNTMEATVRAFGAAIDQAFAKFYAELATLSKDAHAG